MIYDCFTFFNELDLLEIRLNILNDAVDKFVLVEATRTFRGANKPLYFEENKQRFAPFLDKIIHVVVDDYQKVEAYITSATSDPAMWSWAYENFQRHSINRGLSNLKDDDVIIVSDLDEIPTAEAVRKAVDISSDGKVRMLQLSNRSYYLNFCNFSNPIWEFGPMVLSGKAFKDINTYTKAGLSFGTVMSVLELPSPQLVRPMKPDAVIRNAGWHFSYIGGIDKIITKLKSYSHSEYSNDSFTNKERIQSILSKTGDLFNRGDRFYAMPPDTSLPNYIVENQSKYSDYIFTVDQSYINRTRFAKTCAKTTYLIRRITPSWVKKIYFYIRLRVLN